MGRPSTNSLPFTSGWDNSDVFLKVPSSGLDKGMVGPCVWLDDVAPVGLPGHSKPNGPTSVLCRRSLTCFELIFHPLYCRTGRREDEVSHSAPELSMVNSCQELTVITAKFWSLELLEDGVRETVAITRGWRIVRFKWQMTPIDRVNDLFGWDCHLDSSLWYLADLHWEVLEAPTTINSLWIFH